MDYVLCGNKYELTRSAIERIAAEKRKCGRPNLGRLVMIRMKWERMIEHCDTVNEDTKNTWGVRNVRNQTQMECFDKNGLDYIETEVIIMSMLVVGDTIVSTNLQGKH